MLFSNNYYAVFATYGVYIQRFRSDCTFSDCQRFSLASILTLKIRLFPMLTTPFFRARRSITEHINPLQNIEQSVDENIRHYLS